MRQGDSVRAKVQAGVVAAPVVDVEDHGSPVTVFAFSGMSDHRYRMATFEFRRLLGANCPDYNRVFLRDPHCAYYHATPDRQPGGLEFYASEVDRSIAALGSRYNVGIGCSMGAAAALYFGARCHMDLVIAFSPVFPSPDDDARWPVLRAMLSLSLLRQSRIDYMGHVFLTRIVRGLYRRAARVAGAGAVQPLWDEYRRPIPLPAVTVYYAQRMLLERRYVNWLESCGPLTAIGLPTINHNTPGYLKSRGALAEAVCGPIRAGLAQRREAGRETPEPPGERPPEGGCR